MPNGNRLNFTLTFFLFLIAANKILIMKASVYVLIFFIYQVAFSQVGTVIYPQIDPQKDYLGVPGGIVRSGGAVNYNHYDLNGNRYSNRSLEAIDDAIPVGEKYEYENFHDGVLIYKSGNQSHVVKMNYHQLYGEMKFLDERGDTLFIANTDSIAFVRIGQTLYLHTSSNEYLKIISGNNQIKLCSVKKLKLNEGYAVSNGYVNEPGEYKVSTKENFYLVGKETRFEATKSGFHLAFPKFKQQIEGYLQQMARQRTPIKFYKEEDLTPLLTFCSSLN